MAIIPLAPTGASASHNSDGRRPPASPHKLAVQRVSGTKLGTMDSFLGSSGTWPDLTGDNATRILFRSTDGKIWERETQAVRCDA